jgi:2-polyprenyl-3-methyl-5-hydroxy-6-metoxy-1,4-benzoquinol methylase
MPVYSDSGNQFVVDHVPRDAKRVLDVGCGCGDNAALIKGINPVVWIEGITFNPTEALRAERVLNCVHTFDIEQDSLADLRDDFDCLLFSHILEHLREPAAAILRFLPYLIPGGTLVIAVPNVLEWRTRLRFLWGDFGYADYGTLDRTHLKFFTFNSVVDELMNTELLKYVTIVEKLGDGSVPLWPIRRIKLMRGITTAIDRLGVRICPNLFAQQVVIVARKCGTYS